MALFVASSCGIVGDTVINQVSWSHVDQLAAMTASIIDDQDRETYQVMFANNEVDFNNVDDYLRRSLQFMCLYFYCWTCFN